MQASKEDIKSLYLFQDIPEKYLVELKNVAYKRYYFQDEVIFTEGQLGKTIYFVNKGLVKIYSGEINRDRNNIIRYIKNGEIFGSMFFFDNKPMPANARAVEESSIICFDINKFKTFLYKNPDIMMEILAVFTRRLRRAQDRIKILSEKSVSRRINKTLIFLAQDYGEKKEEVTIIDLSCTQEEIADIAGTTRETVTKNLRVLKEKGTIDILRKKIVIFDINSLHF